MSFDVPASPTRHIVSNSAELLAAFDAAEGGDTIILTSGTYDGDIELKNRVFDDTLTIVAPVDTAIITESLMLTNVSNVTLSGLTIEAAQIADSRNDARLYLNNTSDIRIENLTLTGHLPTAEEGADPYAADTNGGERIAGYGYEFGIRIHDSTNVELIDATISDVRTGIYVGDVSGLLIDGADLSGLREGIQFYDTEYLTIQNSYFHDFRPWIGVWSEGYNSSRHDHPDMIQYWGDNSQTGVHHITITDNVFVMPEGEATQTIFGHLSDGISGTDFVITDNLIINAMPNAIRITDIDGVVVEDNILSPNSDDVPSGYSPRLHLYDSTNVSNSGNTTLDTDPTSPLYWKDWLTANGYDLPETVWYADLEARIDDEAVALESFDGATTYVSGDQTAIYIDSDAYVEVALDINAFTALDFEFSTDQIGTLQGIALANGSVIDSDTIFQLLGTDTVGVQDFNGLYTTGSGSQSYRINIGEYITGSYDRLVFLSDDATSTFDNFSVLERPMLLINDSYIELEDFAESQGHASPIVSDDHAAVTLARESWQSIDLPVAIIEDTILSFGFSSEVEGEIHAIGFARDGELVASTIFQLDGSQIYGNQDYNGKYTTNSGITHYEIAVGDYFIGDYDQIVFVNDDDAGLGSISSFANINIENTGTLGSTIGHLAIGDTWYEVSDQATASQGTGTHEVSEDSTAITLSDNAWKSVEIDVTITEDTVLSFDFSSDVQGEIMGIAFVNGDRYDQTTTFQLYGVDDFGIQAYNTYTSADGTAHYDIAVGDYFTGDFDRLVFIADDDAGMGSDATFANISIDTVDTDLETDDGTSTPGGQLLVDNIAYGVLNQASLWQGAGHHQVSEDGTSISLSDNAWKSVAVDVIITEDTVLSFDFSSDIQGEIMGIGFVNGDVYDAGTSFQIYGVDDFGIQAYHTYTSADGIAHYDIAVGDYFTGDFDRLVFIADDDAGMGSDATFANISIA